MGSGSFFTWLLNTSKKLKVMLVLFTKDTIYINGVLKLTYDQSNLPKRYFEFINSPIPSLVVEQLDYSEQSGTLKVKVVDYSPPGDSQFYEEEPEFPIRRIEFDKMDWNKFSPLVYSFTLSKMGGMFFNANQAYPSGYLSEINDTLKRQVKSDEEHLRQKAPNLFFQEPKKPIVEHIQTSIKVKFEKATFRDGCISFQANLKDFNSIRDFTIENGNLRSEFETIKPWFVKRIGESFTATIDLKVIDGEITEAAASSEDISKINSELIESIRVQRVLNLVKTPRVKDESKSLFNHDEIFGNLDEGEGRNVFNSSVDDILQILITNGLAKNIRQLEFLSSDKQSLNDKVRFTLRPHFGFLFKVETSTKQFFIWELLNSHATYVWEREINDLYLYQFVEQEISFINANGREEYRRYYKNLTTKDFKFHLLEHEGADLTEDERFIAWKNKLERVILDFS
ncbi:MAG TPA: hypothetical protein VHK91_10125 [Flavisolibacter sp.]|jgi:hypothetical protein|nr:hypothetical protein [Flavisolibacter sp.]